MNRKGVTPVVATVLLMTITIAATASAFTFMTQVQDDFKESSEERVNEGQREAQSDINIEYAYNSSDGYIMLSVRNTGSISLAVEEDNQKLWNLFVEGRPVGGDGTGWVYMDSSKRGPGVESVVLDPQQTLSINTTAKYPSQGSDKLIKLNAPYESSDSHVCYNSGGASC